MTTYDSRVLVGQTSGEDGGGGGTTIELDINLVGVHDVTKAYSAGDGVRFNDGLIYIATADVPANGASPPNAPWGKYTGPPGPAGKKGDPGDDAGNIDLSDYSTTEEQKAIDDAQNKNLADEISLRAKGEDLQVRTINAAAQLPTFLRIQAGSDTPAIVHFALDVTEIFNGERHTFKTDDVVYFPPKSVVSKTIPLPEPEVSGVIGLVPRNIDTIGDLDRTYTLGVSALDAEFLRRKNTDQFEVWFKDETVHTSAENWNPVADFIETFEVNTTEETNIGLVDGDKIVPVRLVFRSKGTFVGWVSTFLTIGDDKTGGEAAELTDIQKALDLGAYLETPVVERASAAIEGPWRINFDNPTALPDSGYWFTIDVEGQPATQGRVAWAQASSASFTIASAVAEAIFQGAGAKRAIELNLYFYTAAAGRASDYVARLRYGVAFLTPKAPNILQVAVDAGDAAGSLRIVLPANYADWKKLSVVLWESNEDKIVEVELRTSIIAAQTVNRTIRVDASRSDNRSAELTWTRATRAISSADRIIFAELTDD